MRPQLIQRNEFKEDAVAFGLIRLSADLRTRFVLLAWIGEKVKPLRKGIVNSHIPLIKGAFSGVQHVIRASSVDDIAYEVLANRIRNLWHSKSVILH